MQNVEQYLLFMQIFSINIRSINANFDNLLEYLRTFEIEPSVIVLTETWHNDSTEFHGIEGYQGFFETNKLNKASGVAIFVRNSVVVLNHSTNKNVCFDNITVKLKSEKNVFQVSAIYNSPKNKHELFLDDFEQFSDALDPDKGVIMGDFNIDTLSESSASTNFMNMLRALDWNLINLGGPTRITETTNTCIDHVLVTSDFCYLDACIDKCDITDHLGILLTTKDTDNVEVENHKNRNLDGLKNSNLCCKALFYAKHKLDKIDFDNIDINDGFEILTSTLLETMDKYFPIQISKTACSRSRPRWMTRKIQNEIKKRQMFFKFYIAKRTAENLNKFKNQKKKCAKMVRSAKQIFNKKHLDNLLKNKNGEFFKYVRSQKDKNKSRSKTDMSPTELNDYFVSIGSKMESEIGKSKRDFKIDSNEKSMFLLPTNTSEIFEICKSLKNSKAEGHDGISNIFIKFFSPILSEVLASLINRSMMSGVFPDIFKIAKVCPIHKSGSKQNPGNYRPISVLPSLSKVIEKTLHKRLVNFLENSKQLCANQFGFRAKKSTIDALVNTVEKIRKCLDENKKITTVFFDLSKAFDTVDHKILLNKLENYGIRGSALSMISSYLERRYQYVLEADLKSPSKPCSMGVPQGSILGPLLFTVYMNDLPNWVETDNVMVTMFADDTSVIVFDEKDPGDLLDDKLRILCDWFRFNRLSLNIEKTTFMNFDKRMTLTELFCDAKPIKAGNCMKYLGIFIDDRLNFRKHIEYVTQKIAKLCGMLKYMKNKMNRTQRILFYKVYVQPVISYGLLIYGCTNENNLTPILKMQKRILRVILDKPSRHPSKELFIETDISTIHELFMLQLLEYAIKNIYRFKKSAPRKNTRSANLELFDGITCRKNSYRFSLDVQAIKLLNNLKRKSIWTDDILSPCTKIRENFKNSIYKNFFQGNADLKVFLK